MGKGHGRLGHLKLCSSYKDIFLCAKSIVTTSQFTYDGLEGFPNYLFEFIGKFMAKVFKILFLSVMVLSFAGCLSFGRLFNSNTDWIKKNETTQKDAMLVLGEPQEVGSSGGVVTWTYYFYKYMIIGADSRKELKFYWSPDKTVNHFSFSSSFKNDLKSASRDAVK